MSWLIHAGSEEQQEFKQQQAAPGALRSMLGQEKFRQKEMQESPVRMVSPQEHFSDPAIVKRLMEDTMQRLRNYSGLVEGMLSLPNDIIIALIADNELKPEHWRELTVNLTELPTTIDSFNQQVST